MNEPAPACYDPDGTPLFWRNQSASHTSLTSDSDLTILAANVIRGLYTKTGYDTHWYVEVFLGPRLIRGSNRFPVATDPFGVRARKEAERLYLQMSRR